MPATPDPDEQKLDQQPDGPPPEPDGDKPADTGSPDGPPPDPQADEQEPEQGDKPRPNPYDKVQERTDAIRRDAEERDAKVRAAREAHRSATEPAQADPEDEPVPADTDGPRLT